MKPALLLMLGRTVGFVAVFFVPIVLARTLDQGEFGTYKQLFLVAATLYEVGQLGMAESLYYFLPLTPGLGGRYVLNSVLALALGGLACLLLLGTAGTTIARWLSNDALPGYTPMIGVYLVLMLTSAVLETVMVARKRFRSASWIYASLDTLKAGLFIVPALVTGQLGWLVGGAVAFAAARSLVAFWYLSREFGVDTLRPDAELLRRQLAYAVPFALSGIVETINTNLHQYAISYHFDAATFAIYAVGCLQIPLVDFLTTSSARVMMVRMAEEIRDGQSRVVVAVWRDTTRKLALVFFPLAVLLLLSGREIILFLFTERYAASVPVFMVSVLFLLMSPLQVDAVLRVYAQTRFLVVLNLVRLVFIAALITWFLAEFHLIGAILVTVLGTALVKGLALARIRGLLGVRGTEVLPWGSLARVLGAAGAAAVPVLAIKAGLELGPLAALLVTGPVYAAAYAGAAYLVGALTEHEWSTIRGVCERWAPGFAKAERLWRS